MHARVTCVICLHVDLVPHHGRHHQASSHRQPVADKAPPTQGIVPGGIKQVLAPSQSQQPWLNGNASDADGTQGWQSPSSVSQQVQQTWSLSM